MTAGERPPLNDSLGLDMPSPLRPHPTYLQANIRNDRLRRRGLALPTRAARRRKKAPRAVDDLRTPTDAIRSSAVARFADRRVRELSTLPPDILLPGASVSHEVKCLAVRQRLMAPDKRSSQRQARVVRAAGWSPGDPSGLRPQTGHGARLALAETQQAAEDAGVLVLRLRVVHRALPGTSSLG
jgi:hypothetical protein